MNRSIRDPEEFAGCAAVAILVIGSIVAGLLLGTLLAAIAG